MVSLTIYNARSEATGGKNLWRQKEYKDFPPLYKWKIKETTGLDDVPTVLPDAAHKQPHGKDIVTPMPNADSGFLARDLQGAA